MIRRIKEVSGDKRIDFQSCGSNCFKLKSSSMSESRYIKLDTSLKAPEHEGVVLSLPNLESLNASSIRQLLVGHEVHPYISNSSEAKLLRPSQIKTIDNFKKSLDKGSESFLHVSPTSTGKGSVLAQNLIEKLSRASSKKISFITVDKIKLVDQINKEIGFELKRADFSLKQLHWKAKDKRDFLKDIQSALDKDEKTAITLTLRSFMIQMNKLREKDEVLYNELVKDIDGIWIDEVHHLGAVETNKFITELKEESGAFLYGATATPVHKNTEIQKIFEKKHWSYLEEAKELKEINHLDNQPQEVKDLESYPPSVVIKQLISSIERGDITPFNDIYLLVGEKLDSKQNPIFIQKEPGSLYSVNPDYYPYLSEKLSVIFESNEKGMIIVSTIQEAEDLSKFLNNQVKGIEFESYHSAKSLEERELVFENSRSKDSHYIVAVRALDEGVNLPHLSAYIDLNSQVSVKQVVHRIGRVLRPYLNKLKADIFILSSYKNSDQIRELMDGVEQIREAGAKSSKSLVSNGRVSLKRDHLRSLSEQSFDFILKKEEFWSSKRREYASRDKHIEIILAEDITFAEYKRKYKELGEKYKLKLYAAPHKLFKDFSWPKLRGKYASEAKHREIILAENITFAEYKRKYKELGEKYKLKLYAAPNKLFKGFSWPKLQK